MTDLPRNHPAALGTTVARLSGWAALGLAGALLAGAWPTWRISGQPGLVAMAAAAAITLAASLPGSLVAGSGIARRPELAGYFVMAASSIRFALALALAALVVWHGGFHTAALLVWVAITYMALLLTETMGLTRMVRAREVQPAR